MKRSELEVGQVLAYRPSKFGACEAAVVMDTRPVHQRNYTYSEGKRSEIVPVPKGTNVHVVLLSQVLYADSQSEVKPYHTTVSLAALKGDWWEVTAELEIEHNTKREMEAKQAAAAWAAQTELAAVAAVLAKIGVEAKVTANHRLSLELADAELLASFVTAVTDELAAV